METMIQRTPSYPEDGPTSPKSGADEESSSTSDDESVDSRMKRKRCDSCGRLSSVSTLRRQVVIALLSVGLLLLVTFSAIKTRNSNSNSNSSNVATSTVTSSTISSQLTDEDLQELLDHVRAGDMRLFRWDATPETKKRRRQGACVQQTQVANILLQHHSSQASSSLKSKTLAAEYLTFCITDSPPNRVLFSHHEGIHAAVVQMAASSSSKDKDDEYAAAASAAACHLIYIASFANPVNHALFVQQNAVSVLAQIIMQKSTSVAQFQIMWAAAALQNLAASYCATENDGRCYWGWNDKETHVVVQTKERMIIDGTAVRKSSLQIHGLVDRLIELQCTGPVHGTPSPSNIFPGKNAVAGRDQDNPHLVAWAAAGALKNLALEPTATTEALLERSLVCACRLAVSPDWLESLKSRNLLEFMRRGGNPCWFRPPETQQICIDDNFLDDEGYNCGDYDESATKQECRATSVFPPQVSAAKACCGCGGGSVHSIPNP